MHKDGALQQCITELSSNLRRCAEQSAEQEQSAVGTEDVSTNKSTNSHSENGKVTTAASHFVTVIEVKEASLNNNVSASTTAALSSVQQQQQNDKSNRVVTDEGSEHNKDGGGAVVASDVSEKKDKFVSLPLAAVLEAKKKVPPR